MKQLPPDTVRLLSSSQVITSVVNVVKELVENSLDANASSIEVKMDNYGFDRIEVRDNGFGIKAADTPVMAMKHYTSKITSHDDLECLQTYGFRGEALGSICAVSEVIITTKTAADDVSTQYTLGSSGNIISQKPCHLGQGTTVCVLKLFKNLPVRKQFYSTAKKCKEELKKVQDLLMAYAIIKPELRVTFTHNKAIVWQKARVSDHKMALMSVLGTALMGNMLPFQHHQEQPEIAISGYVPKPGSDYTVTGSSNPDRTFIFVNHRPVRQKEILKLVRQHYNSQSSTESSRGRYPVMMMNIVVPPSAVDVNLTPDKTTVMLHNKEAVFIAVESMLMSIYVSSSNTVPADISGTDEQTSTQKTDLLNGLEVTSGGSSSTYNSGEHTDLEKVQKSFIQHEQTGSHDKVPQHASDVFNKTAQDEMLDGTSSASDGCQVNKNYCEFGVSFSLTDESTLAHTQQEHSLNSAGDLDAPRTPDNSNGSDGIKDGFEITAENWSKGHAFKDPITSEWLEPVKIHVPNEKGSENTSDNSQGTSEANAKMSKNPCKNAVTEKMAKVTAYDLISNRTVRQPMSASAIFEQEMRPRILEENPKSSLQDITGAVEGMWKNLREEEKKKYSDKAEKDLARYNLQTKKATEQGGKEAEKWNKLDSLPSRPAVQNRKVSLPNQQTLDELFQSRAEKKARSTTPFKPILFSMNSLKQRIKLLSEEQQQKAEGLQLVNRLTSHSTWVVLSGKKLMLLNPFRVEEALLFKRLLENNILPAVSLQTPIQLTDGLLGGTEYTGVLFGMEKECPGLNGVTYFSDPRLVANGFKLRLIPGASSAEKCLEVSGMADCVPFFGVADLKEILMAVLKKNAKTVEECRPLKVISYLEGEAVRLARQLPLNFSRDDIKDILSRMNDQLGKDDWMCIHGRPFLHFLKDLPD
uniref:PMS1 homolog 1, mismatch repair system component n=1 Tax=Lepisosteus oculatus TaxID=7918 RepID=W5MQR1_LEPOC|nr:PREDICTED: PMS1 protein homolog 1 isoform X1 [Lepisosteus oculatus]